MEFIVVSTLHDPDSRLSYLIENKIREIKPMFKAIIVCCTEKTGKNIIKALQANDIHVIIDPGTKNIEPYKKAIRKGLEIGESSCKFFYIDFDRLLHWFLKYPNELEKTLITSSEFDFTLIGRTKRAFDTHPTAMKATESVLNRLICKLLKTDQDYDIIVASWVFTKELATRVLQVELETSTGFYCLWPFYLWKIASTKTYVEVEGQEYETPDRFQKEIKEMGYESWLDSIDTTKEWCRRVNVIKDCLNDLYKIGILEFNINMTPIE